MKTMIAIALTLMGSAAALADDYNVYTGVATGIPTGEHQKYNAGNQGFACSGKVAEDAKALKNETFYTSGKCWHVIYPTAKEAAEMYAFGGGGGQ